MPQPSNEAAVPGFASRQALIRIARADVIECNCGGSAQIHGHRGSGSRNPPRRRSRIRSGRCHANRRAGKRFAESETRIGRGGDCDLAGQVAIGSKSRQMLSHQKIVPAQRRDASHWSCIRPIPQIQSQLRCLIVADLPRGDVQQDGGVEIRGLRGVCVAKENGLTGICDGCGNFHNAVAPIPLAISSNKRELRRSRRCRALPRDVRKRRARSDGVLSKRRPALIPIRGNRTVPSSINQDVSHRDTFDSGPRSRPSPPRNWK